MYMCIYILYIYIHIHMYTGIYAYICIIALVMFSSVGGACAVDKPAVAPLTAGTPTGRRRR